VGNRREFIRFLGLGGALSASSKALAASSNSENKSKEILSDDQISRLAVTLHADTKGLKNSELKDVLRHTRGEAAKVQPGDVLHPGLQLSATKVGSYLAEFSTETRSRVVRKVFELRRSERMAYHQERMQLANAQSQLALAKYEAAKARFEANNARIKTLISNRNIG
jgi:hypothetical protein